VCHHRRFNRSPTPFRSVAVSYFLDEWWPHPLVARLHVRFGLGAIEQDLASPSNDLRELRAVVVRNPRTPSSELRDGQRISGCLLQLACGTGLGK
jgi:hypothetical protein